VDLSFLLTYRLLYTYSECPPGLLAHQEVRAEMAVPQPDPEQTERLLFLSSEADDRFSTTINDFYASVRQQCQTTLELHAFANGSLSPLQTNQLVVASQEANTNLGDSMRALYQCFGEQKDAKARALSALASEHGFFKLNNALLLKESHELIAQDNELQKMHLTTHSECENLKKQVANLDSERTDLLNRATTAERQQKLLQSNLDHKTRQYSQSQTSVLGLEGQVRQLDRSLVDDHTKLEDEKPRSAELQASIEQLKSNVESLEQALSQSNGYLKVHVEHADTQQTTIDSLKRQVQELGSSLESTRSELDEKKREIRDQQGAAMRTARKEKELEQILQSTKECLAIEKNLSNAGQASTATLTMKLQELEHSLDEVRLETRNENDRHVAQQQNLEELLRQSNDSLEDYMDRCKSQSASIGNLRHQARHLGSSLEVTRKALENEIQQSNIWQASAEELGTTAKQLEASLHFASDCLQDGKSRCNVHQASIGSLTANVRNLEQSLHRANMDLEKHKQENQGSIVSMEANAQKLEKTLELTRSDLGEKRARCISQAASINGLNAKVQASRDDLTKSRQRCKAQQLSITSLSNLKQELEKSLQASRDDLEAKFQLYSSQQPYIDSLKDTERELQRSLRESQAETQAEKDRCITQQSSIAGMERELQELKVEFESTRGQLGLLRAESEMNYSLMALRAILQQLVPAERYGSDLESDSESNSEADPETEYESTAEASGIPSDILGTRCYQSSDDDEQERFIYQLPMLYEEDCKRPDCDEYDRDGYDCQSDYVVKFGNRTCLNAAQTEHIRTLVLASSEKLVWVDPGSSKWLRSSTRPDYPGVSEGRDLAGLGLIDQIVDSMIKPCESVYVARSARKRGPYKPKPWEDPEYGLRAMKKRVALYWSKWYQTACPEHGSTPEDIPCRAGTGRKRQNNDELESESRQQTKRRAGFSIANPIDLSTASDTGGTHSSLREEDEAEQTQHMPGRSTILMRPSASWAFTRQKR
jgi:chromosome segregation ATPase